jgi:hypothetical protein
MLIKEIICVYSGNHTKPLNALCGQNAELLTVKADYTYSYHWILKGDRVTEQQSGQTAHASGDESVCNSFTGFL